MKLVNCTLCDDTGSWENDYPCVCKGDAWQAGTISPYITNTSLFFFIGEEDKEWPAAKQTAAQIWATYHMKHILLNQKYIPNILVD